MYVLKLRNQVLRTGQQTQPLYLMSDGRTTHEKGQARTFKDDESYDSFLRNMPRTEGILPEVEKETI